MTMDPVPIQLREKAPSKLHNGLIRGSAPPRNRCLRWKDPKTTATGHGMSEPQAQNVCANSERKAKLASRPVCRPTLSASLAGAHPSCNVKRHRQVWYHGLTAIVFGSTPATFGALPFAWRSFASALVFALAFVLALRLALCGVFPPASANWEFPFWGRRAGSSTTT